MLLAEIQKGCSIPLLKFDPRVENVLFKSWKGGKA